MNIIQAMNRLRSDIQTWTANNLRTKVNADDLSTSLTTGTITANQITVDGVDVKNLLTEISNKNDSQDSVISGKQDKIEDLSTIRDNASKGAAANNWGDHSKAGYITKNDGDGYYAPKSLVDTVSGHTNTISTLATKSELSTGLSGKLDNSAASGFVPTTRKINGVTLNKDITITATDPNAATKDQLTSLQTEVDKKLESSDFKTVNGQPIVGTGNISISVENLDMSGYLTDIEAGKTYATIQTANDIQDEIESVDSDLQTFKTTAASTYITPSAVDTKIAALVNSAPDKLNTLDELAAALGDDPNFATTITGLIGEKATKSELNTLSDSLATVAKTGSYNDLSNKPSIPTESTVSG
jgi:hypothetical protein